MDTLTGRTCIGHKQIMVVNHGRDDRCISDHGKEPRYPFLDENVVRALSEIPLWEITDPRLEKGYGDKLILRHVGNRLGLKTCSVLPKRAIQFGSRIAKQSAKRAKGIEERDMLKVQMFCCLVIFKNSVIYAQYIYCCLYKIFYKIKYHILYL